MHELSGARVNISVSTVLDTVAEFEQSGGTSIELAAWELDRDVGELHRVWGLAIDGGLLEGCGIQHVDGREERMWRLSDHGRALRAGLDKLAG